MDNIILLILTLFLIIDTTTINNAYIIKVIIVAIPIVNINKIMFKVMIKAVSIALLKLDTSAIVLFGAI